MARTVMSLLFGGRSLTKDERRWTITDKECLAVVCGIKAYRPYLANGKFTVFTDQKALCWLKNNKNAGMRLHRWSVLLQEYDFDVIHKDGKSNVVADALSRREYTCNDDSDNNIQLLISDSDSSPVKSSDDPIIMDTNVVEFVSDQVCSLNENSETEESELTDWIQVQFFYRDDQPIILAPIDIDLVENHQTDANAFFQMQRDSPDFSLIIDYLLNNTLPDDEKMRRKVVAEAEHYEILTDGLLYHFGQRRCKGKNADSIIKQLCLPKVLRADVLRTYHDSISGGCHFGFTKTYESIRAKYWWKSIYADIENYVKTCIRCQKAKRNFHSFNPPLTPMPQVGRFERIQIDILGPITKTKEGYQFILLIIDSFSRWPEAFPLKTQEAKEIASVLYNEIICRYGAPRILFSDRGRSFMSKLVNALCEIFDITQHHTSSYKPSTNG